jgi:hypothetical protein
LLHPAAGHRVRLVSSRSADIRRTDDPPPRRPCPSELFAGAAGFPVSGVPSSSSLVHTDRSRCFPRPRGFAPHQSSTRPTLLSTSRSSHGFPSTQLSPRHSVAGGPTGFPVPGAHSYIGFSSPQRPLHVGARRLPAPPLRMEP